MAGGTIAKIAVNVEANTSRFKRGMRETKKEAKGLKSSLGGLAIAGVFAAGAAAVYRFNSSINQSMQEIDSLAKTSSKLGLTVAELQRLQFAGEQTGVSNENMRKSLQLLMRGIGEAKEGTGTAADAFDRLGINVEQLDGLPIEQKMMVISQAMNDVTSSSDKVAIAMDIFGRSGADMINTLALGKDGLKELLQQQQNAGVLTQAQADEIQKANDAQNRLNKSWEAGSAQLTAYIAPIKEDFSRTIGTFIQRISGTADAIDGLSESQEDSVRVSKQEIAATEAAAKAKEKHRLQIEEHRKSVEAATKAAKAYGLNLGAERRFFGEDQRTVQIARFRSQGVSQNVLQDLEYDASKLRELERVKKLEDERLETQKALADQAKSIARSTMSNEDRYKENILEIIAAGKTGLITFDEYSRAIRSTQKEFISNRIAGLPSAPTIGSLQAKQFNSSSAFESIDRFNKNPVDLAQKQRKESIRILKSIDKGIQAGVKDGSIQIEQVSLLN